MTPERTPGGAQFGTRRRVAVPLVAGFAALASLVGMARQEVLAVSFPTATSQYRIYSDQLNGSSIAGYAGSQEASDGSTTGAMHLALGSAQLKGLCIIASQDLAGLGKVSVVLTAGEPVDGRPTSAAPVDLDGLQVTATSITGDGSGFSQLDLGRAAETLQAGDQPWKGTPGTGGIQASTLTLTSKQIQAAGLRVDGALSLPGLRAKTVFGDAGVTDNGTPGACS